MKHKFTLFIRVDDGLMEANDRFKESAEGRLRIIAPRHGACGVLPATWK
jgi:hypothetical protein